MQILVTGGAGYIGSHVVKQLLEATDHDVCILDNLSTGHLETVETLESIAREANRGALRFYKMDLADFKAVAKLFMTERFDAVLHFAASSLVAESVANPLKYYMNNTVNTTHLVSRCVEAGIGKFIFSSTAAVYGEPREVPVKEMTPTDPINPYGMSKLMSERVIRDTSAVKEDFDYVILRYFNVSGADVTASNGTPRIGEWHEPETHLIPLVVKTALGKRDSITVYGEDYDTEDGTCIRDYLHVEDLAAAHLRALEYLGAPVEQSDGPNIFNVGYGHGFSVKQVIETMKQVSGADFTVDKGQRRAGDPALLIADNSRIKSGLKWQARYDDLALICQTALEWERSLND
ncbi:UDP-glucose 4-epimerase GalE [Sulfurimonas sp. HSL-1656]|uniref:UDP-glucose 4-epimerase GalE n=1 Tax=Thiomicrolovo subterrani TaxID=3131934 RepID=UPI0031F76B26